MYNKEDIVNFRRVIAESFSYKDDMEQRGVTQDDLDKLREMSLSSDVIARGIIDIVLYIFFIGCRKNFDKTITILQNYFKLIKEAPEFFDDRDCESDEIRLCLENQYFIVLPPTPKNYNVIFTKLSNDIPKNYIYDSSAKTLLMTLETCLYTFGPRDGIVIIVDMKEGRLGHIFQAKVSSISKSLRLIEDCCPVFIREVHVLNTSSLLSVILGIIKPLMKSDLLKRVHFHRGNMDYEKFYNDFIPKSCLPSDLGGDLPSIKDLHIKQCNDLKKMQEFFHHEGKLMRYEYEDADIDGHNENNNQM